MLGISGGLRIDHIITHDKVARAAAMGGNAVFAAVGARVWIDKVTIVARAGCNYPRSWIEELKRTNLADDGIRILDTPQDHRTFYAYLDANTRDDTSPETHYAAIGAPMPEELRGYVHSYAGQESPEDIDPLAPTAADITCHISSYHLSPMAVRSHLDLPVVARTLGAKTISVDPGERYMVPGMLKSVEHILGQANIFMPSAMEVASLFGDDNRAPGELSRRMRWFADRGPEIVVFKLGSDGSLIFQKGDDRIWHLPAIPVLVIDVTGAGDSYCGGFAGKFSTGGDPIAAAIAGTVSASFAVEDYGAMHVMFASTAMRDRRAHWVRAHMAPLS